MTKYRIALICYPIFVSFLAGCNWQTEKDKIGSGLHEYLTSRGECFFDSGYPRPAFMDGKQLEALRSIGVLTKDAHGSYDLTPEGRKFYVGGVSRSVMGNAIGAICVGRRKLVEVKSYTEPANMMGFTITKVSYSYSVSELPAWASSVEIRNAFPYIGAVASGSNVAGSATLVKTNNGWVHESIAPH